MISNIRRLSVTRGLVLMLVAVGLVVGNGVLRERSVSAELVADFAIGDAVRVADGPVNFRDAPGLDAEVVEVAPEGTLFVVRDGPIFRDGYTWVKVFNYGYGTGWMAAEFLSYESEDFPGEGQGDAGFAAGDAVRVVDGPVNLRAAAGLDADILDVADDGALFVVRDGPVAVDGYQWVKVFNYYYGTGWMAAEFLAVDPDGFPGEAGL
jgi:hypothetical protein